MENYHVLAGYILVEPVEVEKKTKSGIFIPETARSLKQHKAKIILTGKSSDKEEMELKPGDTVVYSKGIGTEITLENKDYLLLRQRDVLCFLKGS